MTGDERADEIVGRCREQLDRGDAVNVDEVARAHPDLAGVLRERLAVLALRRLLGRRRLDVGGPVRANAGRTVFTSRPKRRDNSFLPTIGTMQTRS